MARNYKKESEWEKQKYKRFTIKVDKELANKFLNKLDKPYALWFKEEIQKFVEKN